MLTLGGVFALVALGLACLGLFGLLSFVVRSRTRELGLRMALGADGRSVLSLVLRHGAGLVATGVAIGLVGVVLVAALARAAVVGMELLDPSALATSAGALFIAGMLACGMPARRASRVDPVASLRGE